NGKAGVFPFCAVSLNAQQQVLGEKGSTFTAENGLMQGPQCRLNFWPYFSERQSETPRMFVAEDGRIAVIVDHNEFGTPSNRHGKARSEHHIDKQAQAWGPAFTGAEDG